LIQVEKLVFNRVHILWCWQRCRSRNM